MPTRGRGPLPKPASHRSARRRGNGDLILIDTPRSIPEPPGGRWHPASINWWEGVYSNPVAAEYLDHDEAIIRATLDLVERFYRVGDLDDPRAAQTAIKLSAEIRQREHQLALGVAERLRQRITVRKPEVPGPARRRPSAPAEGDARDLLGTV